MTGSGVARWTDRFGGRLSVIVVALLVLGALLAPIGMSRVSADPDDDNQTINVSSTAGQNVTKNFNGVVAPGANPTSNCDGGTSTPDIHRFNINVPSGAYSTIDATFDFSITWDPSSPDSATSDLILTVIGPDPTPGNNVPEGEEVGSSDGGSPAERVTSQNLDAGTYYTLVCGFSNAAPQPYNGKVNVKTTSVSADPPLASAPAQGLEFSAATTADPQRDEAEPLIEIAKNGVIYTCGPTGFSQATDYAQVSLDDGDQFHLLGTPPRGQHGLGGGGDCGLATDVRRNTYRNYQYAYTGLGPLTGFTTGTSPNNGRNIGSTPTDENGLPVVEIDLEEGDPEPGFLVDRQWNVFIDPNKNQEACDSVPPPAFTPPPPTTTAQGCVLLNFNRLVPRNVVVHHSRNGGLTYSAEAVIAAEEPIFPGPLRYIEKSNTVYFPWNRNDDEGREEIRLSISNDGGLTWKNCLAAHAPGEVPPFVIADHDQAGNIYIVYSEKSRFHSYVVALRAADVSKCNEPVDENKDPGKTNPGFTRPVQVDRDNVRTTVFPWIAAGGAAGRVAVTFYGTTTDGDPATGCEPGANPPGTAEGFCAAWHVYVNQSLNMLSNTATFSQVRATTHPFHYDSICLEGLACDVSQPPGDRTMADFFSIDYNPASKKLLVTFNRTEKKPNEEFGHIATPMVFSQIAGPKNGGGSLTRDNARRALRTQAPDPGGDALSYYSVTQAGPPTPLPQLPPTENERALDFLHTEVAPEFNLNNLQPVQNGGFTVTMRLLNLSETALKNTLERTGGQSLMWIFRFVDGHQVGAAVAWYNPTEDIPGNGNIAEAFHFGYNDFVIGPTPCASGPPVTEKCILYPADQPIPGSVTYNPVTERGTIRMTVPRSKLEALGSNDFAGRPREVAPAPAGARMYDAIAFSLVNNASPTPQVQSFLYQIDNTRPFDFTLGSGTVPSPTPPLDPVVTLTKIGPATASPGQKISFSLEYENLGANGATGAKIVDTLPPEFTFVDARGGVSRSYDSATRKVTWNLGTIPGQGTGSVTLIVRVSNTASVGMPVVNRADLTAEMTVSPPTAAWTVTIVPQ